MRTECGVNIFKSESEITEEIGKIMQSQDDAFLVVNLSKLENKYNEWRKKLPTITPFYAIKCNPSLLLLKALAALGCGFDCSSKGEIGLALSLGVSPDKIIYANPANGIGHLKYAAKHGVRMITYDNVLELDKIKEYLPQAKLVLRIRADALDVKVSLGPKFGCDPELGMELVQAALDRNLEIIGISFHVGSGCKELGAYARAIRIACNIIRECKQNNIHLSLLDIGGGFPGVKPNLFAQMCSEINETLGEEKDTLDGIRIIAEPGKYFPEDVVTLYTSIIGLKEEETQIEYYVNEGVYGSFGNILSFPNGESLFCPPKPFQVQRKGEWKKSRIWGQMCKNVDLIKKECLLPEMQVGEWLEFSEMGAYTVCTNTKYKGFEVPKEHCFVSEETWSKIRGFFFNPDTKNPESA